ncbi:hypothetical protein NQZ68_017387 [Dissostichus eleginoides]|nr:hypothetical protein NQZ68_017387 [Dissostichus eleginoides]
MQQVAVAENPVGAGHTIIGTIGQEVMCSRSDRASLRVLSQSTTHTTLRRKLPMCQGSAPTVLCSGAVEGLTLNLAAPGNIPALKGLFGYLSKFPEWLDLQRGYLHEDLPFRTN